MNTFYGIKHQMSQVWDQQGRRYPVTWVECRPLTVTQIKDSQKDGYRSVQVGFGQSSKKPTKPMAAHLKKAISDDRQVRYLKEIKLDSDPKLKLGDSIQVTDILKPGDLIQASGVSKGRGFSGVMKRWGFSGGPRTHGQSDRLRAPGSIGQGTDPGRVHKGKKMPGRYGNQRITVRNVQILFVDLENQRVMVSGAIPGVVGSVVSLTKTGTGKAPQLAHEYDLKSFQTATPNDATEKTTDSKQVDSQAS